MSKRTNINVKHAATIAVEGSKGGPTPPPQFLSEIRHIKHCS